MFKTLRDPVPRPILHHNSTFFPTELGWMGVIWDGDHILRLTFGHDSRGAAINYLSTSSQQAASTPLVVQRLITKLSDFAQGRFVEFDDVPVDLGQGTAFQRSVLNACREIGYGQTRTYADLAQAAGSTRAARAVGNIMASNRLPLIIPCHRVVGSGGSLGGYSAPSGLGMKQRLLDLEKSAASALTR